jgi:hypothetical protein
MNNCNNTINQLYEIIEQAVENKTPVNFQDVETMLQVVPGSNGPAFIIPELYWQDEKGNVYQAWMQICYQKKHVSPGLYVVGSKTLDWFSSGDLSMIKPEFRYTSKI